MASVKNMSQASLSVDKQERVGELVAAHRLAKDCLILLGWAAEPVAADGMACVEARRHDMGRFRAASWTGGPTENPSAHWFVAAVRVNDVADMRPGQQLRLHGSGKRVPTIACLPAEFLDGPTFVAELAVRLGRDLEHAVRFLLEILGNKALRGLEAVSDFLATLLDAVAQEDGVIEVLGPIDGDGLLLQGWARSVRVGEAPLALMATRLEDRVAATAAFDRSDLEAPASGFVSIVRGVDAIEAGSLRRVFLRAGNGWRRLTVLSNAVTFGAEDGSSHIREMLPRLKLAPAVERAFRAAARPRFAGHDTVSLLDRPVRMAIDLSIRLPGAGHYVTGWLLDPACHVTAVTLRGASGVATRIDSLWTRVPRGDVSDAFRDTPLLHGRSPTDLHGFTIFVADAGASEGRYWLELDLRGDAVAFMPLLSETGDTPVNRRRILESFDIHKSSAAAIVENHVGPLFDALKRTPKRKIGFDRLRRAESDASITAIVPLVEPAVATNIVVSQFAVERDRGVRLVLVCSAAFGDAAAKRLAQQLSFYDVDADLILAQEAVDSCQALEIGVEATTEERLLFLAPSVHGIGAGWLSRLAGALDEAAVAASPTLLYEDWSVKHAGIEGVAFLEAAPYATAPSRHAGYPRSWAAAQSARPSLAAAIECCVIRRSAFVAAGGFSEGYALPALKGLDLFLRLRRAGGTTLWTPEVEAYALDDPHSSQEYWAKTGEMADGWSFRKSWDGSVPAVAEPAQDARPLPTSAASSRATASDGARANSKPSRIAS
jgi:hypothetical protein